MATATAIPSEKIVYVEHKVQAVKTMTLELNELEARVLLAILGAIGGDPNTSLRKINADIETAMHHAYERAVGVPYSHRDLIHLYEGSLYFKNGSLMNLSQYCAA